MKRNLLLMCLLALGSMAMAQTGTIKGRVLDQDTNEALIGANAVISGTTIGATTDIDGYFTIDNVQAGTVTVNVSFIGYESIDRSITVKAGETTQMGDIVLKASTIGLREVEVIASVAIDRKTPVAVSTIKGEYISEVVGNQEFPEVLRYTPSIYVTKQGGGFGDSRINVRGFDQRNTAVMINGVPVNDMENGWVYWSNWAGLSDVTSTMQVQRGLSASKLATSSVGGSINIITNAAEMKKGGKVSASFGNDGYQKYGLVLSTGLGKNGWAMTIQGTRTKGNGYVQGTKFSAYSYFLSVAKKINEKHSLNFTVLGAPQWHHQRTLSRFDGVTIATYKQKGIKYNHLYGTLDGEEFTWRRNFYHKPKGFMNWYWNISEKTELATTAYLSLGRGGGTGPRGYITDNDGDRFYGTSELAKYRDANGNMNYEAIRTWNSGGTDSTFGTRQNWEDYNGGPGTNPDNRKGYFADKYVNTSRYGLVRRASMNSHNWYGMISNLTHSISDNLTLVAGVDLRAYRGMHYRRMDNLLGADAYYTERNQNIAGNFITQQKESKALVELRNDQKLNYYNDGLVRWGGLFGQLEYSNEKLTAHVSGALSNQGFKRVDYFNYLDGSDEQQSPWVYKWGGNIKSGVNLNLNDHHNVFANVGYFSRQPLFDAVFLNFVNTINPDLKNEKIVGLEAGYGLRYKFVKANINGYYTTWSDRFQQVSADFNNVQGTANLFGIKEVHSGVEIDGTLSPIEKLNIQVMVSIGNWTYADDVEATYFDDNQTPIGSQTLYFKNKKVGDAAQTTLRLGANYELIKGLKVSASWYMANNLYARYSVGDPIFDDPNAQVLKLPSYSLVDAGLYYHTKVGKMDLGVNFNMNNVLDTQYIAESLTNITDESRFDENIAFYGFGRTWNAGVNLKF